jgi:hypothetical protein
VRSRPRTREGREGGRIGYGDGRGGRVSGEETSSHQNIYTKVVRVVITGERVKRRERERKGIKKTEGEGLKRRREENRKL